MTTVTQNEGGTVGGIPTLTASQWQLYSDMKGVKRAAVSLNKALFRAKLYLQDNLPQLHSRKAIHEVVGSAYADYMSPAMTRNSRFGASDTEPRQVAQQQLSDAARKVLRMDKDELDFHDLW